LNNDSYQVKFPNHNASYTLTIKNTGIETLECKHPEGTIQVFYPLPNIYFSKDFEKKGVTEYIIEGHMNNNEWVYFTSQNPSHRIRLEAQKKKTTTYTTYHLKFSNDDKIYIYERPASCERIFRITHPDGREQMFYPYHYDGDLK